MGVQYYSGQAYPQGSYAQPSQYGQQALYGQQPAQYSQQQACYGQQQPLGGYLPSIQYNMQSTLESLQQTSMNMAWINDHMDEFLASDLFAPQSCPEPQAEPTGCLPIEGEPEAEGGHEAVPEGIHEEATTEGGHTEPEAEGGHTEPTADGHNVEAKTGTSHSVNNQFANASI